jgi:hypothetical protein
MAGGRLKLRRGNMPGTGLADPDPDPEPARGTLHLGDLGQHALALSAPRHGPGRFKGAGE